MATKTAKNLPQKNRSLKKIYLKRIMNLSRLKDSNIQE